MGVCPARAVCPLHCPSAPGRPGKRLFLTFQFSLERQYFLPPASALGHLAASLRSLPPSCSWLWVLGDGPGRCGSLASLAPCAGSGSECLKRARPLPFFPAPSRPRFMALVPCSVPTILYIRLPPVMQTTDLTSAETKMASSC